MSEYLKFVDISHRFPKRKTKTIGVYNTNQFRLGIIAWDTGWRRYTFNINKGEDLKFDYECLISIGNKCNELMEQRK